MRQLCPPPTLSTPHHACIAMGSNRSVSGIKIKSLSLPLPAGRHVRPRHYGCCITRIPICQWAFPPDAHARSSLPSANFHHLFTSSLSLSVHLLLLAAARTAITSSTIDKGIPSDARATLSRPSANFYHLFASSLVSPSSQSIAPFILIYLLLLFTSGGARTARYCEVCTYVRTYCIIYCTYRTCKFLQASYLSPKASC